MTKVDHRTTPDQATTSVYDLLPYVYLATGLLTLYLANNGMAVFSGIALLSAAVLAWLTRHNLRARQPADKTARSAAGAGDGAKADDSMKIRWLKGFESGHAIIDSQHRDLYRLGNALLNKALNDGSQNEVQLLFDDLMTHIIEHFRTEEAVLLSMKHPVAESHQKIHRALVARAEQLAKEFKLGQTPTRELVSFIIYDLITDHLVKEDVGFFDGLSAKLHHIHQAVAQS